MKFMLQQQQNIKDTYIICASLCITTLITTINPNSDFGFLFLLLLFNYYAVNYEQNTILYYSVDCKVFYIVYYITIILYYVFFWDELSDGAVLLAPTFQST